jgi:hypothetical protein
LRIITNDKKLIPVVRVASGHFTALSMSMLSHAKVELEENIVGDIKMDTTMRQRRLSWLQ